MPSSRVRICEEKDMAVQKRKNENLNLKKKSFFLAFLGKEIKN